MKKTRKPFRSIPMRSLMEHLIATDPNLTPKMIALIRSLSTESANPRESSGRE